MLEIIIVLIRLDYNVKTIRNKSSKQMLSKIWTNRLNGNTKIELIININNNTVNSTTQSRNYKVIQNIKQ